MSAIDCIEAVQSSQKSEIIVDQRAEVRTFINEYLPHPYIRCGGNLKNGQAKWSGIKARERALTEQWISYNTTDYWNAQIVDCDHTEWPYYLQCLIDDGQPQPTMIVGSPSGTAHLIWFYAKGKSKHSPTMRRMHEGINEALRAALLGDCQFKQYLTKNPLHDAYEVISFTGKTYDFSDFLQPFIESYGEREYVLGPKWHYEITGNKPHSQPVPKELADEIGPKGSRVWQIGHRRVHRRRSADYDVIHGIYEDLAVELGSPITPKALAGIARRSARWMLAHPNMLGNPARDMRDIDEGVMRREAKERNELAKWNGLGLTAKRVAAAERTNGIRQNDTQGRLYEAVAKLWAAGKHITQAAVKQESGLSLRSVERAWNRILETQIVPVTRSNPFSMLHGGALLGLLACLEGGNHTLKDIAALSKQNVSKQKPILDYHEQAKRLRKRGAVVEMVKPRGADASPDLKAAHQAALAALKDCQRRADARAERKVQKHQALQRKEQFLAWAMDDNFEAYKAFLKQESSYWNRLQDAVAEDMDSKKKIIVRRGSAFIRYSKLWKSCCSVADRKRSMRKHRYGRRDIDAAQGDAFDSCEITDLPFALSTNYTQIYYSKTLE